MKKITLMMCSLFVLFALSACETTEGFGRDVQNTGEAIEDAAE